MTKLGKTSIPIPAAALTQHLIALGKTRSGKSSKMRVLVEYLLQKRKPVCIIDPKGDWWGLRLAADGKHPGYPIVIFGGKHADVPLNPRAGAQVAELIFTGNRPCLIDLKGWMPADKTRFFIDFASKTFEVTEGERYLMVDEVHNFAPKGKILSVESGQCLHWMNRLATEAQGMGLLLMLASQRPQKVHNDVLTNCETLIACRLIHKSDRDAIKDWIDGHGDEAIGKEILATVAEMQRSDAWVWSPEIEFGPKRITWPMFETYDSFKPQPAGNAKLKGWADVDLDEVRQRLATVVAEAQANDPAQLRRRIAELEKQLKAPAKATAPAPAVDVKAIAEKFFREGRALATHECRAGFRELLKGLRVQVNDAVSKTGERMALIEPSDKPVSIPAEERKGPKRAEVVPHANGKTTIEWGSASAPGAALSKGEATILQALITLPGATSREGLSVLTGYKRSSRNEYVRQLSVRGFVNDNGDTITVTEAGRAAMPNAEPLPTGEKLRQFWLQNLSTGERKLLEMLIEAYPDSIPRDGGFEQAGYKRSSRNEYLRLLMTRQLITNTDEGVRASDILFS